MASTEQNKMSRKRWDEIINRIPKRGPFTVVEVGVWRGKTASQVLTRCPNVEYYMVDIWERPADDDLYARSGAETAKRPQKDFDEAYHRCVNLALIHGERVHIIKSDSVGAASEFKDGSVDLVFIDGDHSYEGCKRDNSAWKRKVKPGGWIGGHDYAHPDQGDVKRAVDEQFGLIQLGDNRTWWVTV
jgi:hypothetical protein